MTKTDAPISLSAYARHRKARGLTGGSHEAIRKAISTGRLVESIVMVSGKPKIASTEVADFEWNKHTRKSVPSTRHAPSQSPALEEMSFNEARRLREIATWKLTEARADTEALNLREREGELIETEKAREDVRSIFAEIRTKLLGVPTRLKQRRPDTSSNTIGVLDSLIREALEALADG